MNRTERDFRRLASYHDSLAVDEDRLSIDLTRPPVLAPIRAQWPDYVTLLLDMARRATVGRDGLRLEYNRFLELRREGGRR